MVKPCETDCIIVNGQTNIEKLMKRNFMRPNKKLALVPYFEELDKNLDEHLQCLINGIVTTTVTENSWDALDYFKQFKKYIDNFGLRVTKNVFLDLIKFLYEGMIKKDQKHQLIKYCAELVNQMISYCRVSEVSSKDLILDWRPLYDLYINVSNNKIRCVTLSQINNAICRLNVFFPAEEQPKIWEKMQEHISIGVSMMKFTELCQTFLTVEWMTAEEHMKFGSGIWMKPLWDFYILSEMNNSWGNKLLDLFSALATAVPDAFDWSPYYNDIFTKLIRSFDLSVREGKSFVGDGSESSGINSFAIFSSFTIGGPHSSMQHFERTIKCIEFAVHPSNSGCHVNQIVQFLETFLESLSLRYRVERLKKIKRQVPIEYYLKDEDIDQVTKIVVDAVLMLLFSTEASFQKVSNIMTILSSLSIDTVGPKLLNHFYSAMFATSEPLRLNSIMDAIVFVNFQFLRHSGKSESKVDYDIDWLVRMEEERKNFSTFREGTEIKNMKNLKISSLRHHSIYILEFFVNSINVNDINRTEAALKTLTHMFLSVPVVDFSTAPKYHKMSDDDIFLCQLSKRIPSIAEEAFERVLSTIGCLAVCAPKDSNKNIGTMNDFETSMGTEEQLLRRSIDECFNAIFTYASAQVSDKLGNRLFEFVSHIEFESYTATDLLSGIISSCIYENDKLWMKFADFLHKKLNILITDDVKRMKEPPSSILYYVVLSSSLFVAKFDILVKNEKVIFEMLDILMNCSSKTAYTIGSRGLADVLSMLTNIYPHYDNIHYSGPINEWNPIKEWARCYSVEEFTIKWFIPSTKNLKMVEKLMGHFFYPLLKKMEEKLERDDMRRVLNCMSNILLAVRNVHKQPKSDVVKSEMIPNWMPLVSANLNNCANIEYDMKTPTNGNIREMVLEKVEKFLLKPEANDPKISENIVRVCSQIFDETLQNSAMSLMQETLNRTTFDTLCIPVYGLRKKGVAASMESFAMATHLETVDYSTSVPLRPTKFGVRLLKIFVKLALNDYEEIRSTAQTYLKKYHDKILLCRDYLIDEIFDVIKLKDVKNEETLKGALSTVISMDMSDSNNSFIRLKLWDALLRMKVIDEPDIRASFEHIYLKVLLISNSPFNELTSLKSFDERNRKVVEIGLKIMKETNEWKGIIGIEELKRHRLLYEKYEEKSNENKKLLVEHLLKNFVRNKQLHHTREKMARSMVYRCQRETSNVETIKLLLSQLHDEEDEQRNEAARELRTWLKYNKPKTVRVDFLPPKQMINSKKLECGIREDNMCIVYDSQNLPNTEEKWNDMVFIEKQRGCCRWPERIKVARRVKDGPPIEKRELNETEKVILEWFENEENLEKWIGLRRKQHEGEDRGMEQSTCETVKYVIRNFGESQKTLDNFATIFEKCVSSKRKEDQIIGAELFVAIVMGIKHREFRVHDAFWKKFSPIIDRFLDNGMNSEAANEWEKAVGVILSAGCDHRRVWWLIEGLFEGAKRVGVEEWRQARRLEMLNISRWRYMETANRLCEIGWNKLPLVLTETARVAISKTFQNVSWIMEANWNNTYKNIDKRFQLESTDVWIERLKSNVSELSSPVQMEESPSTSKRLSSSTRKRVRSSKSDHQLRKGLVDNKRKRRSASPENLSELEISEKRSMIYFRTILEFLQQYYELCYRSWTPEIISILPKLFEYANENNYDLSEDAYRNVDIVQNCSYLIHEIMSSLWLPAEHVDLILSKLVLTFETNIFNWRVREAVLKYIHVLVYSNIFGLKEEKKQKIIEALVFNAIGDPAISVRREASKCLLLFIHCDYVQIDDKTLQRFSSILHDPKESTNKKHGAALVLGASVMAFPFSIPPKSLHALKILSSCPSKFALIKNTITETLREFRRHHRDDWIKIKKVLGETLVFEIENAMAPVYYA